MKLTNNEQLVVTALKRNREPKGLRGIREYIKNIHYRGSDVKIMGNSTISSVLKELKEQGIVKSRKTKYYRTTEVYWLAKGDLK